MKEGKKERKEDLIANANAGGEKQGKGIETKRLHEKKIQERPETQNKNKCIWKPTKE